MPQQNLIIRIKTYISKIPLAGWLIGGGVLAIALYSFIFFIPKTIQFSYAEAACVPQFVLAPGIQKADSDAFTVQFKDEIKVGTVVLASTKVCVEPDEIPEKGAATASIAPFGSFFARKQFAVIVPEAPVASAADIVGKTISIAKPLKIKLTAADALHSYKLKTADKTAPCNQADAELLCEVAALELAHGAEYTLALHQSFKSTDKKVVEGKVATQQPLALASASVANDQTIFDKPTSFAFTFDRPITESSITLVKIVGDATEDVPTEVKAEGAVATLSFAELARDAKYRVDIKEAIGDNGSSLAAPVAISFTMSGGPKVASVSVGSHSVARNASIVVTFDQPIAGDIDISKLARIEGVGGTVKKTSDRQLSFAIQGGDCSGFALVIDKGMKSSSNGEVSKDAWKFNSRTICGSSWSIGQSVKGRSIIAYSFGSGSKTILFTGGMHGSEPSGYTTMMAWVKHLQAYGDIVPGDKRVVIVPNTNPDGIAAGTRYNSRNVNIGRNFPTRNWKADIETAQGVQVNAGGTSKGSEPESAALIALTRQLKPRLQVSFHAQGRLVGANKFGDSVAIGDMYAKTVGYRTMFYNAEAVMGYPMTGEYEDWMGEEMNIPAILIELPSHSGNYFSTQLSALKKMLTL